MRFIPLFILMIMISVPVKAACYTAAEAEAEQAIRIHSELMVIGLNCQHMTPTGWKNFYTQYREITNNHQSLFSDYEQTLVGFYSRNGSGNGEKEIHNLRTGFANKVSTDAAQMRPDIFCATFAPRIPKVAQMSRAELQQWASTASQTQPLTQAVCN